MKVLSRGTFSLFLFICFGVAEILSASFVLAAERIDINTAPAEELQKITGVGPVKAQRIIEARPFSSVHDLIKVNGIGEITLQKIIEQGLAWVALEFNPDSANIISLPIAQKEFDGEEPNEESQKNQPQKRQPVFLTALGLAIFSGAIIIFIKKKLI